MSPLQNRIDVGQESYAVFVADGEGDQGDLYAVRATGGPVFPITYTLVDESAPALSPDGVTLAFLRVRSSAETARRSVWVMNLLNGAERELPALDGWNPRRIAWSRDGAALFITAAEGNYRVPAPPAKPQPVALSPADSAVADSALGVWLGQPAFARAVECPGPSGGGLCLLGSDGATSELAENGRDPSRWGQDSLGYFVAGDFLIRPLGAGVMRPLGWVPPPPHPRQLSYFEARAEP
ncbi:MAG: TolB family protein [Gemmatimonadales bacterium]